MKKTLLIFSTLILLLNACGGSQENTEQNQSKDTSQNAQNDANQNASKAPVSQIISILNHEDKEVMSVDISPKEVIIKYDQENKRLTGEAKNSEKTKYYNEKGDILAEVHYKEDGFKLKTSDGKLIWKIKFKEDKTKISDNEEGDNPFEIKSYPETGKFKAKSEDKQWSEVKYKDGIITLTGSQIYKIKAKANASAYTLLGINPMPEEHRLIIMAELLKKGK